MCALKVLIHSFDSIGHVNACLGLAQQLAKRGNAVVFVVTCKAASLLEGSNFDVEYLDEGEADVGVNMNGVALKEQGLLSAIQPKEKLERLIKAGSSVLLRMLSSIRRFESKMRELIDKHKPDVMVVDHFIAPPSISESGIPWVYLHSSSALSAFCHANTPPTMSGYATYEKDDHKWQEFDKLLEEFSKQPRKLVNEYRAERGYGPEKSLNCKGRLIESPYLNVYQYPQELDYTDVRPMADKWIRVDTYSTSRFSSNPCKHFEPKLQEFLKRPGKLIYFSIGTVGCLDTELIQRVSHILAALPHRIIVSKGRMGDDVHLDQDNVYSSNYVPQVEILPFVDLVITHGGNNTFTEAFAYGKPMIVMPLFSDQFDNAQRIHETNYGVRINPYTFTEKELHAAIDQLLNDPSIQERYRMAEQRIRNSKSLEQACAKIESLAG